MGATPTRRRFARNVLVLLALIGILAEPIASGIEPSLRAAADVRHGLTLRGRAAGLYPGGTRRMRVLIRNRTDRDVRLVRLSRRVVRAASGCPTRVLRVRRPRALPVVPAGGRARMRLRVRLLRSAPDACQGVVFVVRFRARGVAA